MLETAAEYFKRADAAIRERNPADAEEYFGYAGRRVGLAVVDLPLFQRAVARARERAPQRFQAALEEGVRAGVYARSIEFDGIEYQGEAP
jgi:hypothetical protein